MKRSELLQLSAKGAAGLNTEGASLNIAHCTAVDLTTLSQSLEQKMTLMNQARGEKALAYLDLRTARAQAGDYLEAARDYLKPRLKPEWSELWLAAGFPGPTLALPRANADRLTLLAGVKAYFTAHPELASEEYDLGAAPSETRRAALAAALQTVSDCKQAARAARDTRDGAETALAGKLHCLWDELESVLSPTDNRWLKFLDRIPGDLRVPEAVGDIEATAQPGGLILVDWPDALRAARYKVFKQVVNVDADPVLVATVEDSNTELTEVPAGATVRLQIVATNATGDAAPSAMVEVRAA